MSNYLKEAWELHISNGEKVELQLAPQHSKRIALAILRNLKSRSAVAFSNYGMFELAASLTEQAIRFKDTSRPDVIIVWLEPKEVKQSGTFRIITDEELQSA